MSLIAQGVLVFGLMLLIMGYFQYRRSHDIISITQEMFRPSYLMPAVIVTLAYIVIRVILTVFNGVL
jgi:hypothetical protein